MDRGGGAGDEAVGASGRDQRHARRQSVVTQARGNGDRAQVEQVHEVGVSSKPGVEAHGVGLDLGDGIETRRGRNDHRIKLGPDAARLPFLIREPIKRLERGYGVELARTLDNRASDGKQSVRIALDERLGRGVALGDPWTFVERPGDLGEWLKVELDDFGQVLRYAECRARRPQTNSRRRRTGADPGGERQAETRSGTPKGQGKGTGGDKSVLFVERAGLLIDHEGVFDIASENRDGIERAAGGDDAERRERAKRRLQPHDFD